MAKRNSQLTELLIVAQNDYLTIVDTSAGQSKRVSVKNLTGLPNVGWTATGEAWSFSSWTSASNVGVITVPTDATTKYTVGMFVRIAQSTGGTKYGRILALTATTLSVWMPGYTLNNEAISSPVYSPLAAPYGIPAGLRTSTPYKFSAYRNAALNSSATPTKIAFDAELFDTGNNFDAVTNRRFTAPVAGYYQFSTQAVMTQAGNLYALIYIYVNGVSVMVYETANSSVPIFVPTSALLQLAAGDYVEVYLQTQNAVTMTVGRAYTFFDGNLVSEL